MRVLIVLGLCSTLLASVYAAGSEEACPSPASTDIRQACSYNVQQFGHFRDCSVDLYMSLCALLDSTHADWPFICTNPNYCLGCRYGYGNCVNDSSLDQQAFYLSWYDGMVLGGKYTVCDMGSDYLTITLTTNQCAQDKATTLEACAVSYMQLFQSVTSATDPFLSCKDMNDVISCFLHAFDDCADKTVFNIYQRYFRGVVSLTQCQGSIAGLGTGSSVIASAGIIMAALIALALIH